MLQDNFKLVLIGNGDVGKSTWVRNLRTSEVEHRYIATMGVEVHPIRLIDNNGDEIIFKVWDCAGREAFGGLREGYYVGAECAIIMDSSGENFNQWEKRLNRDIPTLRVLSKVDTNNEEQEQLSCDLSISTFYNLNVLEPLSILARRLLNNNNLVFTLSREANLLLPAES